LSILADMTPDQIGPYIAHVGFDVCAITDSTELPAAWVAHYRLGQGTYDLDRACMDLATFPPVSRRIFALQAEKLPT
ncbi:hypothetical protein N9V68_01750, partial [Octadecabacter sp.]|nr:hypothetical protein [Octadecabacter sp.]